MPRSLPNLKRSPFRIVALLTITAVIICSCNNGYFKYELYYSQIDEDKIETVHKNWNQYFGANLNRVLSPSVNSFSLRLDSYGCVYPDDGILTGIDDKLFKGDKSYLSLESNSFYGLFGSDSARSILKRNCELMKDAQRRSAYNKLLELALISGDSGIDAFTTLWDSIFLTNYEQRLQERIGTKKKILFFVHGYNVPYSLAALQFKEFIELADSITEIDTSQYLFIPVCWPSNDLKNHCLDSNNFNVKDKIAVANLKGWNRYSNRAYYTAYTLRHVLTSLDSTLDVKIFTHSLGATVATSALIDTRSKLHVRRRFRFARETDYLDFTRYQDSLLKLKDHVTYDFTKAMVMPLPTQKITVFMNAPAIPGVNTFVDLEADTAFRYMFYSGYNHRDKMVGKFGFPFLTPRLSSTSLGANHCGEVEDTKNIFSTKSLHNNFYARETGKQSDHDIFAYFKQKGFRDMLILFFKSG